MPQQWTAEHIVTEAVARKLIEDQFAELRPVKIKVLGEGFDNTVYKVNESFVFRFPRREVAVSLLKTENHLLPELVSILPIQIPEPTLLGNPANEYPWPFTGYRLVQGETIGHLTNEQRMHSVKPLADFLRILHSFPVYKARENGVPNDELNRLDLGKRRPQLENYLQKAMSLGLNANEEAIQKYVNIVIPDSYQFEKTLVQGDLHVRNLLVDTSGKVSGIIDWGDTHIGNPAIDLSIVYSFLPPEGRETFYQHYGDVDPCTRQLARFKAIYTAILLVLYGDDLKDDKLLTAAKESLELALSE